MKPATRRRLLVQLLLFILIAANIELFAMYRLRVEGFETADGLMFHDARRGWRPKPAPNLKVNSDGLRGDEIPSPRGAAQVRVICLGGSVTYSSGVADGDTYPEFLQRDLRLASPDAAVVNGGMVGFASHQFLQVLLDVSPRYKPNVIVAMFGMNERVADLYRRVEPGTAEEIHQAGWRASWHRDSVRSFLYYSATYRYLLFKLRPVPPAPETPAADPRPPETLVFDSILYSSTENVRLMQRLADAQNAHFLVCEEAYREKTRERVLKEVAEFNAHSQAPRNFVPDPLWFQEISAIRAAHAAMAREAGIAYLDMHPAIQASGYTEDELFLPLDRIHYTPLGCAVAARIVHNKLVELGWVKGKPLPLKE